jgi:hypothetical protein
MAPTADADPFKTDAVTREKERRLSLSKQFDEIDNEMETLTDKMASKKKKTQKPRPVNSVGTETGPSLSPVKQQTERTGALFSPGGPRHAGQYPLEPGPPVVQQRRRQ